MVAQECQGESRLANLSPMRLCSPAGLCADLPSPLLRPIQVASPSYHRLSSPVANASFLVASQSDSLHSLCFSKLAPALLHASTFITTSVNVSPPEPPVYSTPRIPSLHTASTLLPPSTVNLFLPFTSIHPRPSWPTWAFLLSPTPLPSSCAAVATPSLDVSVPFAFSFAASSSFSLPSADGQMMREVPV